VKNYENQSTVAEVIIKIKVPHFFEILGKIKAQIRPGCTTDSTCKFITKSK